MTAGRVWQFDDEIEFWDSCDGSVVMKASSDERRRGQHGRRQEEVVDASWDVGCRMQVDVDVRQYLSG